MVPELTIFSEKEDSTTLNRVAVTSIRRLPDSVPTLQYTRCSIQDGAIRSAIAPYKKRRARITGIVGADELVFLGGCAAGLLLTDVAAPPVRATRDVDVITDVGSLADYYQLSEKLRALGFLEDAGDEALICRWKINNMILDVMPTNPDLLDFGNQWYRPAVANAQLVTLPPGAKIRMATGPFFLATKLAAFDGRGKGDYMASHEMEDIISVIDGRPELVEELRLSSDELRRQLTQRFRALLEQERFIDSLPGHLPGDAASQARMPIVIERIETIAESG